MIVTVDEMKNYLRIDFEDDDALIDNFITAAEKQCMDILRTDVPAFQITRRVFERTSF